MPSAPDPQMRDKTVALLSFLKQAVRLRRVRAATYGSGAKLLWFADVPKDEPECRSPFLTDTPDESSEVWLEVRKRRMPARPALPQGIADWVRVDDLDQTDKEPELRPEITVFVETRVPDPDAAPGSGRTTVEKIPKVRSLSEHPEVQDTWLEYLVAKWEPWATEMRRWQEVQRVYEDLDFMRRRLVEAEERYELLLALGFLQWQDPTDTMVKRHLLTAPAEIALDAARGILTVFPAASFEAFRIELDMLEFQHQPHLEQERLDDRLAELDVQAWNTSCVGEILHEIGNRIRPDAEVDQTTLKPGERGDRKLRITYAPAIVLRERRPTAYEDLIDGFLSSAQDETRVIGTEPWHQLLSEGAASPDAGVTLGPKVTGGSGVDADRFLFPLPANEEQRQIVHRLRSQSCVLVKGPPGTGKSHTIANLICHLLASGQRVLVTAYAPKALAVLRGLLPEDIRDLCVTSLGSSRDDQRFLEESVGGILRRKNEWRGPLWDDQAVSQTETELRHRQDALAGLERRLRECREAETYPHTLSGGYQGTAARIARRVEEERERFNWFPQLDRDEVPLPIELREIPFLAEVHAELTEATREELCLDLGGLLPTPEEFTKLVDGLAAEEESADRLVSGAEPEKLNALNREAVDQCLDTLLALEQQAVRAERVLGSMAEDVLKDLLVGSKERWQRLARDAASLVDAAATLSEKVGTARIQLAADVDQDRLRTDVRRRRDHFAEGGRRGVWFLAPRVVRETRYVEESCLVDGQQPRQAQLLDRLADFLGLSFAVQEFARLWPAGMAGLGDPKAAASAAADLLKELQDLLEFFGKSDPQGLGVPLGQRADLAVPEVRTAWLKAAEAASACRRVSEAKKRLEECVEAIRRCQDSGHHHSCLERLAEAVRGRDSQAWGQAWRTRELLRRQQERLRNYEELVAKLTRSCPGLGQVFSGTAGNPEWKGRILELDKAWGRASACAWLRRVSGQDSYRELVRDFHRVQKEVEKKTEELVALLAWREFFARLDEGTRQNLVAWTAAMRRGGKFTGKYSYRHRRTARGHLMRCVPKMPAWVMPLHKLWDTVGHEPGLFDTVIVDEASQAGVESLALLLLARRIIVVGDDKQNSPEAVGILEDDIAGLIRQHLSGFRFCDEFRPDISLFDHGVRAFGNQVSLREHFRCVPEIIRFSNDMWYRDAPLIPLRQAPPRRLAPLKEQYIPEGSCEGERSRIRNRAEAEAVVATIQSLVKDKDYEGKTMGVIALQGRAQAELIERLLGEGLEPSVIEDRKLRCGEPATFQGDERDVMFLSMVIAPNVRYNALTVSTAQRRFNVAMSRARDQVWLFHSVKQHDLSPECLRRHLLRFFERPDDTEGGLWERLEHLEREARKPRRLGTQPEPYESWFEVDVALELLHRSYMVRPQVEVAGKRIDLVVEGIDARLAVECDGDEWHGAEQFEQDMSRQRQLERAGWTFVRVRASDFYANRADAVAAVVDACEELGVRPRGIHEEAHVSSAAPDSDSQGEPVPEEVEEVTEGRALGRDPAEGGLLQVLPAGSSVACGFPDPRDASPSNVRAALRRIIETDGPVTRDSVYRLYVDGCAGLQRAGKVVRQALNQALAAMLRSGEVVQEDELRDGSPEGKVLRTAGSARVRVRPAGKRDLLEIPPSELLAVLERLFPAGPSGADAETVLRALLDHYGFSRLTKSRRAYLLKVLELWH